MNINVPQWAEAEFWDEPPDGSWEFWSFRFPPPCKAGDPLVFKFRGVVVARAVCAVVEGPGITKCDHSGRFSSGHKVFWKPDSFVEVPAGRALVEGASNPRDIDATDGEEPDRAEAYERRCNLQDRYNQ